MGDLQAFVGLDVGPQPDPVFIAVRLGALDIVFESVEVDVYEPDTVIVDKGRGLKDNFYLIMNGVATVSTEGQFVTVNKALADFAHRGWIRLEGKSVLISDSERLARRAR